MTRDDIHEAAKKDTQDGVKPGGSGEKSESGSGFGGIHETGADAVPQNTTGATDPDVEQPS